MWPRNASVYTRLNADLSLLELHGDLFVSKDSFLPPSTYSRIFIFSIIGLVTVMPIRILSHGSGWGHNHAGHAWCLHYHSSCFWTWAIIGTMFSYVVSREHEEWWSTCNHVFSSRLDIEAALDDSPPLDSIIW